MAKLHNLMKDRVVHNNTKIHTNKKVLQSNANRPLTERCMAYIVNKFQQVGVGSWSGVPHVGTESTSEQV